MSNKNFPNYASLEVSDIRDMVRKVAQKYGDKNAFGYKVQSGVSYKTYTQLYDDMNALGTALIDLGLKDKHVAIVGENSYLWAMSYFSVVSGLGVVVPVDKELPANEMKFIMEHGDAVAIIYSDTCAVNVELLEKELPQLEYCISMQAQEDAGDGKHFGLGSLIKRGIRLMQQGDRRYLDAMIDPGKMCIILYTSGTTGTSKGVMLSHINIATNITEAPKFINMRYDTLSVLPYHHTYECTCGMACVLSMGRTIYINDNLKQFSNNLNLFKPSMIMLVPLFVEAMYKKIWDEARKKGKDKVLRLMIKASNGLRKVGIDLRSVLFKSVHQAFGGNLKILVSGGAPLSPPLMKAFRDIGIILINGYGITECSPLVSLNRDCYIKDGTVGQVIERCQVKIDHPDENGDGEILIKGDNVMLGYYKNEQATNEALKDGWFYSGDFGRMDKDGFLSITGRKKNLIVLKNGKNVYPEEIEGYFTPLAYIKEVVVTSKDTELGHDAELVAEVFVDETFVQNIGMEAFKQKMWADLDAINKDLPVYKRVSDIVIRDEEFPKTTTKKIKRFVVSGGK